MGSDVRLRSLALHTMGRSDYGERSMPAESARLAELIGGLTLAADLVNGFPPEKVLRTAILAVRIGERAGLDATALRDAYYLTLFRFLGCTGFAHEEAHYYGAGNDIATRNAMALADAADPVGTLRTIVREVGEGASFGSRALAVARLVTTHAAARAHAHAQCEVSIQLSTMVGMSPELQAALSQVCERYDGRGFPASVGGTALLPAARLLHVADVAEIAYHRWGVAAAVATVTKRSGKQLDPALSSAFLSNAGELLSLFTRGSTWQLFLEVEPAPATLALPDQRDKVALAFARFADLKSVYTLTHSSEVERLATRAAELAGVKAPLIEELRIAARLHDLGRVNVPNRIWDKPGPLDELEWERVRLHAYYTERILARSKVWAGAGKLAAATHERLDEGGYHRGIGAGALGQIERLLAAADVLAALLADRPHRKALSRDAACDLLRSEVEAGRLARDAVDLLVAAVDGPRRALPSAWPKGLSDREVEVLRLVAIGKSNAEAGELLGISPKTVKNHVANVYSKIGVYSRAGAALFATEHDLLGPMS